MLASTWRVLIKFVLLPQRSTLRTFAMFSILAWMRVRLARQEEPGALQEFLRRYRDYMQATPAFTPALFREQTRGYAGSKE